MDLRFVVMLFVPLFSPLPVGSEFAFGDVFDKAPQSKRRTDHKGRQA